MPTAKQKLICFQLIIRNLFYYFIYYTFATPSSFISSIYIQRSLHYKKRLISLNINYSVQLGLQMY